MEYKRLKEKSPLIFSCKFVEEITTECLKMVVHNIQSLNLHFNVVKSDILYKNVDIICLHETWTKSSDNLDLENFHILNRHDNTSNNKAQGSIIYFKSFLMNQIRLISSEVYNNLSNYIIIDCFCVSNTFIIIVYKSPKISLKELLNILIITFARVHSLGESNYDIIVSGDFNIDFLDKTNSSRNQLIDLFKSNNLIQTSPSMFSTSFKTQIDVTFTNNLNILSEYFESVFSYHKVTWILFGNRQEFKQVVFNTIIYFNAKILLNFLII